MGGSYDLLVDRPGDMCKHIAHMNVASLNLTRHDYILNNISTKLITNNGCTVVVIVEHII